MDINHESLILGDISGFTSDVINGQYKDEYNPEKMNSINFSRIDDIDFQELVNVIPKKSSNYSQITFRGDFKENFYSGKKYAHKINIFCKAINRIARLDKLSGDT